MERSPTLAEIETLREAIDGCGGSSYTQAIAILDRLSPPAPEVDEATEWTRKVMDANWSYWGSNAEMRSEIIRQAISELIASKDAEIERLKSCLRRISALEYTYDGSDLEGAKLIAEQATEPNTRCTYCGRYRWEADEKGSTLCNPPFDVQPHKFKAAERNAAEAATDTTPEVVVTQAARDVASRLMKSRGLKRRNGYEYTIALQAAMEAEARGRRAALRHITDLVDAAVAVTSTEGQRRMLLGMLDELKRMMTETK